MKSSKVVQDRDGWQTVSSKREFTNSHLEVVTDEVKTPARPNARRWTVVRRKAAVIIAAMSEDEKLLLIRQERVPIRDAIWEMPAGQIDGNLDPSPTDLEEVALRELREETGYELQPGGKLITLGHYFSSPGFTDEHGYFFLAKPVSKSAAGATHDETESILDCRFFSAQKLARMIGDNEIRDANTLSIFARLVVGGFISLDRR